MTRMLVASGWIMAAGALAAVGQPTKPDEKGGGKPAEPVWEVRLADGKVQKVSVLDETITLDTAYGQLKIPSRDVRRIEFGIRYSATETERIGDAVADVLGSDARTRERGKEALLQFGAKAYPLVARLAKNATVSPHLTQVQDKLKTLTPETDQTPRDYDLIVTADDSRLGGTLVEGLVRGQAGGTVQEYKWSNARLLVNGGSASLEEKVEIVQLGPNAIFGLAQTHFNKVVGVQITGRVGGSVWGSGPYTTDSDPGTAAVHSGALKVGETAVIKIRVKADAGGYVGSTQNGVTTANWGPYQGCYEILGKPRKN